MWRTIWKAWRSPSTGTESGRGDRSTTTVCPSLRSVLFNKETLSGVYFFGNLLHRSWSQPKKLYINLIYINLHFQINHLGTLNLLTYRGTANLPKYQCCVNSDDDRYINYKNISWSNLLHIAPSVDVPLINVKLVLITLIRLFSRNQFQRCRFPEEPDCNYR